jgi:hypothetical protein
VVFGGSDEEGASEVKVRALGERSAWVMAEKDGTFEIADALSGKYALFAMSTDQKRFSKKLEVFVPHVGGPKDFKLRLLEGGKVKFIVGAPEGKPVPGVKVFHLGDDGQREELFRKFRGTRRDTFESWLLGPGKEKFVVAAPGWKGLERMVEIKAGGVETVEVEIHEAGTKEVVPAIKSQ